MLEVVVDTETTGLKITEGHKIVEIGCVELNNQIPTGNVFHSYINPKKTVSKEALKIHGYSNEFLSKQKVFSEIADDFLGFIREKKLIIHNADFDLSFLNNELKLANKKTINKHNVVDTLMLAREKFPGSQASLDALCKRFKIDNSKREKHDALTDCELLVKVYINLIGQKEPILNFAKEDDRETQKNFSLIKEKKYSKFIRKIKDYELQSHKNFLKKDLKKNFY